MKKVLALMLAVVMALSIFAACGKTGDDKKTGANGEATITIGIPESALVMDYYENDLTKWLEEQTGYTIEFQKFAASSGDYSTQLSTMCASGMELPDILWNFSLGDDVYEEYGQDGYFVKLNDYFDDKEGVSKSWWERFDTLDEEYKSNILRRMKDDNGDIYDFPGIQTSLIDIMEYQPWINQTWLDKLGLSMPTNLDELYNVLVAFRDKDPNGNGKKDEIPLIGSGNNNTLGGDTLGWLINMFTYVDNSTYFNVDDNGNLYLPHIEENYRKALVYLNKLVKEGLMSSMTLTAGTSELKPLVSPSDENSVQLAGVVVCHPTLGFTQGNDGLLDYEAIPMWGNVVWREDQNYRRCFITADCENPEAAFNVLVTLSNYEGSIRERYGNLGEHWDYVTDTSAKSFMGLQAEYILYEDVWSTQGDDNWRVVDSTILINAEQEGATLTGKEDEITVHKYELFNTMRANWEKASTENNPADKNICPLLITRSDEEEQAIYQKRADVRSYISKARSEFITGVKDPSNNADWNAYVDQLYKLGLQDYMDLYQELYNDYVAAH